MTDVQLPPDLEQQLDRALGTLAAAEGFTLSAHVLDAVGTCRDRAAADSGPDLRQQGRVTDDV